MLEAVKRPDGKTVQFEYDALGRRTAKFFDGTVNRYVWDGNVLLHEWHYPIKDRPKMVVGEDGMLNYDKQEPIINLTTWLYEAGSFTPSGKQQNGKYYSIVSDYLGTPVQAFDETGASIWARQLNCYGAIKKGDSIFVPFLYQGQYADAETGLAYNRFRYYDVESGFYISQDPIGLGGNNPNFYAYVHNCNSFVDVFGLAENIDPSLLNYSQGYASGQTEAYEKAMRDGTWNWNKFPDSHPTPSALRVVEVNGELVSLDNRRLLAAQNAGLTEVPIIRVMPGDAMPGGGTYGKNLKGKLNSRPKNRPDLPKIELPETGTKTKPIVIPYK